MEIPDLFVRDPDVVQKRGQLLLSQEAALLALADQLPQLFGVLKLKRPYFRN